jgi:hypothetical protein
MSYTPIPKGTDPWDVQVNTAFTDQDTRITTLTQSSWMPSDYGILGWAYDPSSQLANMTMTTGLIYMAKVKLPASTVSALGVGMSTAGSGLTAGQSFMALYNNSGALLGQTADQAASWTTTGYKQAALVTPVVVTAGYYHVAIFSNGTTPPGITRGNNLNTIASISNLNLTAADARWATAGTATTAPPASITMSGRTITSSATWAAVA